MHRAITKGKRETTYFSLTQISINIALTIITWCLSSNALSQSIIGESASSIETFNDWAINCTRAPELKSDGLNSAEPECVMSQNIEFEDTSDPLLQVDLYLNPADKKAQAVFILPLGIPLKTPPSLAFSNAPSRELKISHCHQDGCYFIEPLTPRLLETLLSMSSATLTLMSEPNKVNNMIRIPISGSGSRAAYQYYDSLKESKGT